jgi:hypothetical protein
VKEFEPGTKLERNNPKLSREFYNDPFVIHYRLNTTGTTLLYRRQIERIIIVAYKSDTVQAIRIYLPFDTTLCHDLEAELGVPEYGWTVASANKDLNGFLKDRYWYLPNYSVSYRCTRNQYVSVRLRRI